jgi:hypothetical protein
LTAAAYHNSDTEGFVMDDLGNRDGNQTLRQDGTVHFAVDPLTNRYTAIAGHPLAYDAAGTLTQDKAAFSSYDYENRIVEVPKHFQCPVAGFDYDTQGPDKSLRRRFRATTLILFRQLAGAADTTAQYPTGLLCFGNYIDEVLQMNRGGSE